MDNSITRRGHCQQSPGVYDARPGRLGQGRGGENGRPSVLEGTMKVTLSNFPLNQKPQVQRAQHVVIQALPDPAGQWASCLMKQPSLFAGQLRLLKSFFTVYGDLPLCHVHIHSS